MLRRTVRQESNAGSWKAMPNSPRARKACGDSLRTSTFPSSGTSSPATSLSSVDLPQPDGPMIATKEPRLIFSVTDDRACVPTPLVRNVLLTPSMLTSASSCCVALEVSPAIRSGLREQRHVENVLRSLETNLFKRRQACVHRRRVNREEAFWIGH